MTTALQFLGAAGTVTGSRHLLEHGGRRILLDCGLFQGGSELRQRNWQDFPVEPASIDAVVLSHAHIDHTGFLPRLCRLGFQGPVWSTPATRDLCALLLPDSGRLQEEEANYANKERYTRHQPALPLYTERDAELVIPKIRTQRYGVPVDLGGGVTLTFGRAGHILGSAVVQLDLERPDGFRHRVVYSGDLGRYGMPVIPDPEGVTRATTLLVESTYGDRLHDEPDPSEALAAIVNRTVEQKGTLLIPAFAVGRTQDLLYHLRQLQLAGRIPASIPIFVDSPMACDVTPLYLMHREEHDEQMVKLLVEGKQPLHPTHVEFTRSVQQSRALNTHAGPMIVISASGMATGGRIVHHLKHRLPDPRCIVLFVGYQAEGSRGRRLLEGATELRLHGEQIPVRAKIEKISGFSAHADHGEVDRWLGSLQNPPERTFCIHGEPSALEAARARLTGRGWNALVPSWKERVTLG